MPHTQMATAKKESKESRQMTCLNISNLLDRERAKENLLTEFFQKM